VDFFRGPIKIRLKARIPGKLWSSPREKIPVGCRRRA
jgi:hypothetical protein